MMIIAKEKTIVKTKINENKASKANHNNNNNDDNNDNKNNNKQ